MPPLGPLRFDGLSCRQPRPVFTERIAERSCQCLINRSCHFGRDRSRGIEVEINAFFLHCCCPANSFIGGWCPESQRAQLKSRRSIMRRSALALIATFWHALPPQAPGDSLYERCG